MSATVPTFPEFFRDATGHEPYLWQIEVARRFRAGEPVDGIDVPTGLGKTGILYAWCWALAAQAAERSEFRADAATRSAPLRLHMVVDRRVVVDDTFRTATVLADKLAVARDGSLGRVAAALRTLGGTDAHRRSTRPLEVRELRGGLDERAEHVRSVTVPTIVVGTVDMVMSRLLWRGYGVSVGRRPLDAALVGVDSTIVLDEAHLAPQTLATLAVLTEHGGVLAKGALPPLRRVVMSATLPVGDDVERVTFDRTGEVERQPELGTRLARRAATALTTLASALTVEHVVERRPSKRGESLVVFCNTAARARDLFLELEKNAALGDVKVVLLHGGMPESVAGSGRKALDGFRTGGGAAERGSEAPTILVTTQTLEVGADLDFDHAVTEPAPLDSLVQRIGRVNRAGARDGATVTITGVGPVRGPQVGPYPAAVVTAVHEQVGRLATVGELDELVAMVRTDPESGLVAPPAAVTTIDAPTLFDLTVTEGLPGEDPVSAWIRLPDDSKRVDVVVRDGLEHLDESALSGYLSVLPARPGEAWSVPLHVAEALVATRDRTVVTMPGTEPLIASGGVAEHIPVRTGATLYVSTSASVRLTRAERAEVSTYEGLDRDLSMESRGNLVLPVIWGSTQPEGCVGGVVYLAGDPTELQGEEEGEGLPEDLLVQRVRELAQTAKKVAEWVTDELFDGRTVVARQEGAFWYLRAEEDASASPDEVRERQTLASHSEEVESRASRSAKALGLSETEQRTIALAARRHDWGKLDCNFQRQLAAEYDGRRFRFTGGDGGPWGKSALPPRLWSVAARAAGVVPGWRHEALSVAFSDQVPTPDDVDPALLRHLIGTHHGWFRGLTTVVGHTVGYKVCSKELPDIDVEVSAHNALQSGFDPTWWTQFVDLTERYGPYHLALLEAVVRFADWEASGDGAAAVPVGDDTNELGGLA